MARSRSLPRSLSRHVERSASFAAGAANGGGGGGGGGAAQRSRVPGARLRALADKSGLPLEPLLQMVADGEADVWVKKGAKDAGVGGEEEKNESVQNIQYLPPPSLLPSFPPVIPTLTPTQALTPPPWPPTWVCWVWP